MNRFRVAVLLVCLVAGLPVSAFVAPPELEDPRILVPNRAEADAQTLDPQEASAAGLGARGFLLRVGGQWEFSVDRRTMRPALVQGSGLAVVPGSGNALDTAVLSGLPLPGGQVGVATFDTIGARFVNDHAALIKPSRGRLVLDSESSLVRGNGRLATLNYDWFVDGVQVEGAAVFLRFNSGNLTQFGAPLVGEIDLDTTAALTADEARDRILLHGGHDELYRLGEDPRLLIQTESAPGDRLAHRLVWRVTYTVPERIETWEGRVDAHTGEIVGFVDTNQYARAVGGVIPRTPFSDVEITVPLPQTDLVVNGSGVTTDAAGQFPFTGGSAGAGLNGRWFNTSCQGCSNPVQPGVSFSVGTGRLDFGQGGVDEIGNGTSTQADRTTFYHLTQTRRILRKWLPNLGWSNNTITSNTNILDTCNAVYNGAVNFYRSGGGCNNTGLIADVIDHEYGHGIDGNTRGGDGATGEATADIVAMHMTQSPVVGPGFTVTGGFVRHLDQFTNTRGLLTVGNVGSKCPASGSGGPLGYQVHCEGEIYGQAAWDLSQALVAKHGYYTGWRESERIFFSSLPDAGSYLATGSFPIYSAYLNADDDDGNLANGTPNGQEIYDAFNAHGIAGAAVSSSTTCARPAQPNLIVTPQCDRFDLSWNDVPGIDHYEIFRGEVRLQQALFPVTEIPAGQTGFTDLEVAPGVDYWYTVMAVDASGCESLIENPEPANLVAQPILSVSAAIDDDTPRGNRSGFADPGEEVDLVLDLANFGEIDATAVTGTVISTTPGVTLVDGDSAWPAIPVGGSAGSLDALRFTTDDLQVSCGDLLSFQFVPDEASGCAAETSYFDVMLGQAAMALQDNFETDSGWSYDLAASTTVKGVWERGAPNGTTWQPGSDSSDPGSQCWYTAANPQGFDDFEDVDAGASVLLSPAFDLSGIAGAQLTYSRWFANSQPAVDPGDFFEVEASDDDGASWVRLERLDFDQIAPLWTEVSFLLDDFISLTSQVRLRFTVADGVANESIVEAAVDNVSIQGFVCDDTPACFVEPTFAGVAQATPATTCAATDITWQSASSNCQNATVGYNVYRSTDPGFMPGPANLVAAGLTGTGFADSLLQPDQIYYYVVRAHDSRSGEDSNLNRIPVLSPASPDGQAPSFGGLESVAGGAGCGEAELTWSAAIETCNAPVSYEIYRSTDPAFIPGPANRVGSSLSTDFVDATLQPDSAYTYVVRSRDGEGNEDLNDIRFTVDATNLDRELERSEFEAGADGWSVVAPNDAATGNWERGDPEGTGQQPEDDATPNGTDAWITGLPASVNGGNNDIDGGSTTLLSRLYDLTGSVDPAVRYQRWFTNDTGASPGEDPFVIEVSNDAGAGWSPLEQVGAGTPLAWVDTEIALSGILAPTAQMQFRFTAADLGAGSLVEAGIDDFIVLDRNQGCLGCPLPVGTVGTILIDRSGDDVVLDWSADPAPGSRFAIYRLDGPGFSNAVRIGTSDQRSFVHAGAALSIEDFAYRVSAIDGCGNESGLK